MDHGPWAVSLTVTASAVVDADPQAVWDLYADVEGSVDWVPFAEEILYMSGPAGLGQVYRERTRLLGASGEQTWTVVAWDPPRRQVQESTDMRMRSRLVVNVTSATGGASFLRQSTELRSLLPRPVGWIHEAVFALVAGYGIRRAVAAAKRRLEKQPA
jgi:hypothetical protein